MKESTNSVTYDAATEELTVTTYYEKEQYLDTNLRRAYYLEAKYIFTSKDPEVRKSGSQRANRVLLILSFLLGVYDCLLISSRAESSLKIILFFSLVLIVCNFISLFPPVEVQLKKWEISRHGFEKKRKIKPTWQIIEQEFAANPIFRQTVTLTSDRYTVTSPFSACPSFTVQREGKGYVKLLPDGNNLYLFHKREKKRRAYYRGEAYLQEGSAYFLRKNYSTEDWALLISRLREMKYL